jgi:hypothetical protein
MKKYNTHTAAYENFTYPDKLWNTGDSKDAYRNKGRRTGHGKELLILYYFKKEAKMSTDSEAGQAVGEAGMNRY